MVMAKTKISTLQDILSSRARATFSHRINFDKIVFANLDSMRSWCNDNCTGLWRCEANHALYFQFEESRDATMFMLRWGGAEGNKLK
jgi:hypothetical protein